MEPATDTHAATALGYASTFPGRADHVSQVRREIAAYLAGCPAADDIILIASELAANAILHTQSRGSTFTVRCQLSTGTARIEIEDLGGPWRRRNPGDRPHGLDIVQAQDANPGDKLPTQAQITTALGISEATARRASRELARLVPGHGYYPGTRP